MPAHLIAEALIVPDFGGARVEREIALAVHKRELAYLRLSILLTAKWELSESGDAERRNELRAELAGLRRSYSQRVDEIAMAFCVQDAMNARQEVERSVDLPSDMTPCMTSSKDNQVHF
jgi:hypothetical protein